MSVMIRMGLLLSIIGTGAAFDAYPQSATGAQSTAAAPAASVAPPDASQAGSAGMTFYMAPKGNDTWTGKLPEPNAEGTDGPFATLEGARDAIRRLKEAGSIQYPITVLVRGGIYRITQPFTLESKDSGDMKGSMTYGAYPGEQPVISGGRVITGWAQEGNFWTVTLPEVTTSDWRFSSIWVDGQRRMRSRLPHEGFFHTAGKAPSTENPNTGEKVANSSSGFRFRPGEIKRWDNLEDALVVVLHAWETSFHHISSIDDQNNIVLFRNPAAWPFENWAPEQRYYVLNTLEGLDAPGEWYLNQKTGKLYYYPMPGEDLAKAEVIVPAMKQLLSFEGSPNTKQFIEYVHIKGLRFHHADFSVGPEGYADVGSSVGVNAAVQARGARFCVIEDCEFAHMDTYAIWLRLGCVANLVQHNHLFDLGAGGIRIGERQHSGDLLEVDHNTIDNNFIHDGGYVYRSGVGIWVGQSPMNTITHNEICDLSNTGISVGWAWNAKSDEGFSFATMVQYNRVHDIGKAEFSNMAGIYVLSGSPNSVVANNVVHDIMAYQYGGWGIHLDEGVSYLVIENNIVWNTTSGGYDQFLGNLDRVQNNIFAASGDTQVNLSNTNNPIPIIFERNIVVTNNGLPFGANWDAGNIWQDYNCYWDTNNSDWDFGGGGFAEWRQRGKDYNSAIADPQFVNPAGADFNLKPDSPALEPGFRPIDAGAIGLYGDKEWVDAPNAIKREAIPVSKIFESKPAFEDFEGIKTGYMPPNMMVFGALGKASVAVTDETAASGAKSLKVTDSEGPQEAWQPEMCYIPRFREGAASISFDIRLEPGAICQHDWRGDWTTRRIGPRITMKDGALSVGEDEKSIMQIPMSQWFHVEVLCNLGKAASTPATYTLLVSVPGQETRKFENLPCVYPKFRSVERAWFLAAATKQAVYYLDNVKLELK